jgi:hypothetical protein
MLCQHSGYFATALKDGNEDLFIESSRGVFEWPDDEPEQVRRWMRWLYSCSTCRLDCLFNYDHVCKNDKELDEDPDSWCHPDAEPEQAFLLGDRLLCPAYCRFALGSFVQHVDRMDPYRIVWTHASVPASTSLHRFVHAWLGWMKYRLDKRLNATTEEESKAAAFSERFEHIDGWRTDDPKKFLVYHWSEVCSVSNQQCDHKRPLWYWRHAEDGKPGTEPRTVVRSISRTRQQVCRGILALWVSGHSRVCALPLF